MKKRLSVSMLFGWLFIATNTLADGLMVSDAWIRESPPGAPMAGYLILHNHGDEMLSLTGASSEMFDRAMIHRSFHDNGVAKMEHLDSVFINPEEKIRFEPGGLHLMLMEPADTLKPGDEIKIVLVLENEMAMETEKEIIFVVKSASSDDSQDHAGHSEE